MILLGFNFQTIPITGYELLSKNYQHQIAQVFFLLVKKAFFLEPYLPQKDEKKKKERKLINNK